jgi:hypothetical protein
MDVFGVFEKRIRGDMYDENKPYLMALFNTKESADEYARMMNDKEDQSVYAIFEYGVEERHVLTMSDLNGG